MNNNVEDHATSLVSITGESNRQLHLLANLYHEPFDAESVLSVVVTLSHKPDVKWKKIYSSETWCTSMDQSKGGTLYVVSMEGEMHVFRGGAWTVIDLEAPDGLNSVWAADDNESFTVGLNGERIRINGDQIDSVKDENGVRLNAVHGSSSSNVMAVGDEGQAYRFDGDVWTKVDLPTNVNLLCVHCLSDECIVVGGAGVLFRWDGEAWFEIEAEDLTITNITYWNEHFYLACGRDGVFVLQDDELSLEKEVLIYRLNAIGDNLFGVANRLVAQYDGEGWWGGDLDL
ncbi:MAG: hypothetical protein KZQ99_16775 [Candidatus Thiodiazotropha sp. (ex Dulcina madagascariensis)]|nr:hypothetical protein [Candidatus Thiodiazotropha sp. (ex Dulcina madagascariensis)]